MKRTILTILMFATGWELFAQDIHFSQFYTSPLTLNPATTGIISGDFRVANNIKSQWGSITHPFTTLNLSYDMPILEDKITDNGSVGVGGSVMTDRAGDLNFGTTQINLAVSSNKSLDDNNNLSVGIVAGFTHRSINFSNAESGNQFNSSTGSYDPAISTGESFSFEKFSYADFGTGILWSFTPEKLYTVHAGAGLLHLNKPNQSFYKSRRDKQYPRVVVHGGSQIDFKNSKISLLPNLLFLKQGPSDEFNIGTLVKYKIKESAKYTGWVQESSAFIGGWYRFGDAFIIVGRVDVMNFSFGISYDFNVSGLTVASKSRGGTEFSLVYTDQKGKKRKKAAPLM